MSVVVREIKSIKAKKGFCVEFYVLDKAGGSLSRIVAIFKSRCIGQVYEGTVKDANGKEQRVAVKG